jgi:hypothetical protein
MRETGIAQVMTSTKVGAHPTAFSATGLPILRIALDVERMDHVLAPLLAPLTDGGVRPRISHAKLLAYKQGNRGTIHYDCVTRQGEALLVIGKLYPQPAQVTRVDAILRQLAVRAFAETEDLGVPFPLGGVLDLSMLVYVPVDGDPLDDVLVDHAAPDAIDRTAAWLATLHHAQLELDRRLNPLTEVVNLQAWAALVGRTHEHEADRAARLAAGLEATSSILAGEPEAPIHKDFHYKHVLVDRGVQVIDFDEVRFGDPMYDVAHFCAHLRLLACRNPDQAARIAAAEGAFLRAYTEKYGGEIRPTFFWYAAYTCLKIAKQLCTTRGVRPRPDGEEQVRQLGVMLGQGLSFHDQLW